MVDNEMTEEAGSDRGAGTPSSREVDLYSVYQFLAPHLGDPRWIPGTPSWSQLEDTDPAKWSAVLWAAIWWAVGEEARQDAITQAGEAIWEGEDWAQVSQTVRRRREIDELRRSA